jgi:hypothetical protein
MLKKKERINGNFKKFLGLLLLIGIIIIYYKVTNNRNENIYYSKDIYYFKLGNEYVQADEHFVDTYNDKTVFCIFTKDKKTYKTCDYRIETVVLQKEIKR